MEKSNIWNFYCTVKEPIEEIAKDGRKQFKVIINPTIDYDYGDVFKNMINSVKNKGVEDVALIAVFANKEEIATNEDLGGSTTERVFKNEELISDWLLKNGWKINENAKITKIGHRRSTNHMAIPVIKI